MVKKPRCKACITCGGKRVALLTWTTDMHCFSWSLPAFQTCPGAVATDNRHICFGCYASQGRYAMPNVIRAQAARLAWLKNSLSADNGREFVRVMVDAIAQHTSAADRRFRVHDSGDIFSAEYGRAWARICKRLPDVRFWFPTRSYHLKNKALVSSLRTLAKLDNVVVRPSALLLDGVCPEVRGLSAGSTAIDPNLIGNHGDLCDIVCPKTIAKSNCAALGCSLCWHDGIRVAYIVHGAYGHKRLTRIPKATHKRRAGIVRELSVLA